MSSLLPTPIMFQSSFFHFKCHEITLIQLTISSLGKLVNLAFKVSVTITFSYYFLAFSVIYTVARIFTVWRTRDKIQENQCRCYIMNTEPFESSRLAVLQPFKVAINMTDQSLMKKVTITHLLKVLKLRISPLYFFRIFPRFPKSFQLVLTKVQFLFLFSLTKRCFSHLVLVLVNYDNPDLLETLQKHPQSTSIHFLEGESMYLQKAFSQVKLKNIHTV